ncbi:hypothetical protein KIPB_007825 [Kipferlia bialata]|uniref:Uncharacterized protein n=1 Tax=Kipferlia bialata TaxID=797122 RepID=A0A9K3D1W2_9EUKA|nr:hypothetical protein KIPB_007825 [Kipferlia bialata]|eukprot:g7825.t1
MAEGPPRPLPPKHQKPRAPPGNTPTSLNRSGFRQGVHEKGFTPRGLPSPRRSFVNFAEREGDSTKRDKRDPDSISISGVESRERERDGCGSRAPPSSAGGPMPPLHLDGDRGGERESGRGRQRGASTPRGKMEGSLSARPDNPPRVSPPAHRSHSNRRSVQPRSVERSRAVAARLQKLQKH